VAHAFRCSIVTPSESVFEDDVTYAEFPAWDGQQGMLAGQSPLLTRLGVGPLRVDLAGGGERRYLIDGGFAQVQDGSLTLLTEYCRPRESLKAEEAETVLTEARSAVTTRDEGQARAVRDQRRALAMKQMLRAGG
jgi:F-type H+-transporting ATPase subunit epsilon